MAVIARKQLTGSTQKIKEYAGHEGQLVFDKQTKHLHVLSGTAGKTTELANKSDIPTVDGGSSDYIGTIKSLNFDVNTGAVTVVKSDDTVVPQKLATDLYVADKLKTKEDKGTAYSKAESNQLFASKGITEFLTIQLDGVPANSGNNFFKHTDPYGTQFDSISLPLSSGSSINLLAAEGKAYEILQNIVASESEGEPYYVKKLGDRGALKGYEKSVELVDSTLTHESPDMFYIENATLDIQVAEPCTKVGFLLQPTSIKLAENFHWVGGKAPDLGLAGYLVVTFVGQLGLANYIKIELPA